MPIKNIRIEILLIPCITFKLKLVCLLGSLPLKKYPKTGPSWKNSLTTFLFGAFDEDELSILGEPDVNE